VRGGLGKPAAIRSKRARLARGGGTSRELAAWEQVRDPCEGKARRQTVQDLAAARNKAVERALAQTAEGLREPEGGPGVGRERPTPPHDWGGASARMPMEGVENSVSRSRLGGRAVGGDENSEGVMLHGGMNPASLDFGRPVSGYRARFRRGPLGC